MYELFTNYVDNDNSISSSYSSLYGNLKTIAERYIKDNPAVGFSFRAYRTDSFRPDAEGVFSLDLNDKYPDAAAGQKSIIAADIIQEFSENLTVNLCCFGGVAVYLNGKNIWNSCLCDSNSSGSIVPVVLPCIPGRNHLALLCTKNDSGFGCTLSANEPFWRWIPFYTPFYERAGQGGFVFSQLIDSEVVNISDVDFSGSEKSSGLVWFPELNAGMTSNFFALDDVFNSAPGKYACIWTKIVQHSAQHESVNLSFPDAELFVDGIQVSEGKLDMTYGEHDVFIVSCCPEKPHWNVSFSALYQDGSQLELKNPGVDGADGPCLYLGPLSEKPIFTLPDFYGLFGTDEKYYWKINRYTAVRPYLEKPCFGKFSYPLGVVLYGLTQTGRILHRSDILDYVKKHIHECVSMYEYSLWDRQNYGYPEINNQIVTLGCLDSCGSFGSAMLETYKDEKNNDVLKTADAIADYIEHVQPRLDDGVFYRPKGPHPTMWADDQYMSIPFLCRYYMLTDDKVYIDDAVKQVKLFRKYLYMPDKKVMSHVLDFGVGSANRIPWGRGNGWTLFSLTELLEYLPENHKDRRELLEYLNDLCEGYLALQGSRGLWHQVLTMPDSYEETSCTAMFVYSFCRAVRFNWVNKEFAEKLFNAAVKGWRGLENHAIDRNGNIYGVCKGSWYSFDAGYYKEKLGWNKNDTHGTGIVLLAGIELSKLL